jgi:hypothetical protein
MYDVVLFKVTARRTAEQLTRRLQTSWLVWAEPCGRKWSVGVELRPDPEDLALLLREVARWAGESGQPHVPFELDGRTYSVFAAEVAAEPTTA